jgi:nucleoid DNA-binding protein
MTTKARAGMEELVLRVQAALSLATKKEAELVVGTFIDCLEGTLLSHLDEAEFSVKLNGFGKFTVHHKPSIWRKVGYSGEMTRTKPRRTVRFVSLGRLRLFEPTEGSSQVAR